MCQPFDSSCVFIWLPVAFYVLINVLNGLFFIAVFQTSTLPAFRFWLWFRFYLPSSSTQFRRAEGCVVGESTYFLLRFFALD